ncbi:MAG TPA: CBS domain-containing protein [Firmicutes bacterium]|nr:CBS domain-containing protein [Candidatus Fermentithermobacillaceae bacterium]
MLDQEHNDNDTNAGLFLEYFRQIERILGRTREENPDRFDPIGFKRLVRDDDTLSKVMKDDLEEFADLRNAIVHRSRRHPIAEPNEWVIKRIKEIAIFLADPPRITYSRPITLEPSIPIREAMDLMRTKGFSQVPVCQNGVFVGLLTTDTIARWLADSIANEESISFSVQVSRILPFAEDTDTGSHDFLHRNAAQVEVIRLFSKWIREGRRLSAVLITENGRPSERLLGIVTVWDLPGIYRDLQKRGM